MIGMSANPFVSLLDAQTFGGRGGAKIRSVQYGVTDLPQTVAAVNVTISAVDLSKAIVLVTPIHAMTGTVSISPADGCVMGVLLDSTTLQMSRVSTRWAARARWTVIEFEGEGVSVQTVQGTLDSNPSTDITISPVDVNRSFAVLSWKGGHTGDYEFRHFLAVNMWATVTDSTTLRVEGVFGLSFHPRTFCAFVLEVK